MSRTLFKSDFRTNTTGRSVSKGGEGSGIRGHITVHEAAGAAHPPRAYTADDDVGRALVKSLHKELDVGEGVLSGQALESYTETGNFEMNEYLRHPESVEDAHPSMTAQANGLADFLKNDSRTLTDDLIVWRGSRLSVPPDKIVGAVITDNGIVSTSLRENTAKSFAEASARQTDRTDRWSYLMQLNAAAGTHAYLVPGGEKEVLLPPGTSFRVDSVSDYPGKPGIHEIHGHLVHDTVVQKRSKVGKASKNRFGFTDEDVHIRLLHQKAERRHRSGTLFKLDRRSVHIGREEFVRRAPTKKRVVTPIDRRVVMKSVKRTLYVRRNLLNAEDVIAWAKSVGFETCLLPEDMHCTIAYSKTPVDWFSVGRAAPMVIAKGGFRFVERFDGGATVLQFESRALAERWGELCAAGCEWKYPEYKSHITLSYNAEDVDLSVADDNPFTGVLKFGPEIFQEIDLEGFDGADAVEKAEWIRKGGEGSGIKWHTTEHDKGAHVASMTHVKETPLYHVGVTEDGKKKWFEKSKFHTEVVDGTLHVHELKAAAPAVEEAKPAAVEPIVAPSPEPVKESVQTSAQSQHVGGTELHDAVVRGSQYAPMSDDDIKATMLKLDMGMPVSNEERINAIGNIINRGADGKGAIYGKIGDFFNKGQWALAGLSVDTLAGKSNAEIIAAFQEKAPAVLSGVWGDKGQYRDQLHSYMLMTDMNPNEVEQNKIADIIIAASKKPANWEPIDNETAQLDQLAGMATRFRGDVLDRLADSITYKVGEKYPDFAMYGKDYSAFQERFVSNWTISGGGPAYSRSYVALQDFGPNKGNGPYWMGKEPLTANELVPSQNLRNNLEQLYANTQKYYQDKFATKANPTPDLSQKEVVVQRGVGGHVDAYTPAPVESWTVDTNTPDRFGKMMSLHAHADDPNHNKMGDYAVLTSTIKMTDVLATHQSLAGVWPKEGELKGKKEFITFGGALGPIAVQNKVDETQGPRRRRRW